jgi:hypothetical protein
MHQDPFLYVLVRIRKSGSQSLVEMIHSALPASRIFSMPPIPPKADLGIELSEDFRRVRRTKKRLWKLFKTLDYPNAWKILDATAQPGDVVSGHFHYGAPVLPSWKLKYITIVREPVRRLFSEYQYCRKSYLERPFWRHFHIAARLKVAGRGSFDDYVGYLHKHREQFANPMSGYIIGGQTVSDPYDFLCQNYFHFGTLEKIGTFTEQLSIKLGSTSAPAWKNKTSAAPGKPPADYDANKVQDLLGMDIRLYEMIDRNLGTSPGMPR